MSRTYHVYILASGRNGTLYTGVTGDLAQRMEQHRDGKWRRAWKLELIERGNPQWLDLYDRINGGAYCPWVPAFAGMTMVGGGARASMVENDCETQGRLPALSQQQGGAAEHRPQGDRQIHRRNRVPYCAGDP
ncbi:GIY-YIG nuclease family protein [Sphingopyxis terrae]|uniref:GIY-YIG nuclease family protein n=1 Tax=Sphingopyxis terrae TaxID=33052 RepID=UPI002A115A40|nr:GIY-YIG nuclease family protein [Sphingopyxis terrae]MDX8357605.1 GIY-YIG nuclease family protein [Sphingopyxis terrae]